MSRKLFNPAISVFKKAAENCNGKIKAIAKNFKVHPDTVNELMNRSPDHRKIINDIHAYSDEYDLDASESLMRYCLSNYEENLPYAFRAAEKIIDLKGHKRGWGRQENRTTSKSYASNF